MLRSELAAGEPGSALRTAEEGKSRARDERKDRAGRKRSPAAPPGRGCRRDPGVRAEPRRGAKRRSPAASPGSPPPGWAGQGSAGRPAATHLPAGCSAEPQERGCRYPQGQEHHHEPAARRPARSSPSGRLLAVRAASPPSPLAPGSRLGRPPAAAGRVGLGWAGRCGPAPPPVARCALPAPRIATCGANKAAPAPERGSAFGAAPHTHGGAQNPGSARPRAAPEAGEPRPRSAPPPAAPLRSGTPPPRPHKTRHSPRGQRAPRGNGAKARQAVCLCKEPR